LSEVRNNPELNRFELDVAGGMAVAYYRAAPGRITITHTEVPTALRGRGIGSVLVKGALELARAQSLRVVSRCPFVSAYLGKHPEYNDLQE
jgi:predicted GNAT family acetyltransferase